MTARTLLVTHDEALLEDMLRLAAAAGVTLEVAHDASEALRGWSAAGLVLVGADLLTDLAGRVPPRRAGVHVVGQGAVPDNCFRQALTVGAEHVVELPAADDWMVELLTDVADGVSGHAPTVAVLGGCGGAGATTFAAALATTASGSVGPVTLVDADPLGGGIDRVVGLEAATGARWDTLTHTHGRIGARFLRESLPSRDGLAVLTWSPQEQPTVEPAAAREALSAAQRGSALVVVDLPRRLDAMAHEILARCDHVLLVSGLTVPAVAAAVRVVATLEHVGARAHLVARTGGGLDPEDVAGTLGLPLLVEVGEQRRLSEAVDIGLGPVHSGRSPLARASRVVLTGLLGEASG